MSADRPPPRHASEPTPHRPLALGDAVNVFVGASGWQPAFVVGLDAGQVKVLLDAPRRSVVFSDAFATGFDSNGLHWLDAHSTRLRRRAAVSRR